MSLFLMSKSRSKRDRLRLLNMAAIKFEIACQAQFNNVKAQYMLGRSHRSCGKRLHGMALMVLHLVGFTSDWPKR